MFVGPEEKSSVGEDSCDQTYFLPQVVEQCGPVIQRLQVRILWEDNFFALHISSSRRSGGPFLGFRAGSLKAR